MGPLMRVLPYCTDAPAAPLDHVQLWVLIMQSQLYMGL